MDSDYDHDYEADEDASKVLQRNVDAHQDLITNAEARLDKQDPAQTSDCKASLSHALAIEPEIEEADSSPDDGVALPLPTPTVGIRVKEKDMSSRKRRLGKDPQIQILTRKVNQYKKLNAELRHQLSKYYSNEAIGFLENKVKEKQLHVELLVSENKSLLNQQRLLERQLEELQDSANSFPQKAYSMREELRICKEKLRQYREKQKVMDEKAFKMHQQIVDLAAKNKGYCDRIRIMEIAMTSAAATATTSSRSESSGRPSMHEMEEIIANQEDAITRLQQKVALHKKVVKTDHSKYEKVVKQSQDAVNELRAELDSMSQQLFEKERVVRAQVLYIKKLKRSMRELSASMQSNQHLQQYTQFTTLGRDGRVALQQFSPRGHTATGPQVREALYQLGFMPSYASLREEESRMQADEAAMLNHTPSSSSVRKQRPESLQRNRDATAVPGAPSKLIPVPPSTTSVRHSSNNSRTQLYTVPATITPGSTPPASASVQRPAATATVTQSKAAPETKTPPTDDDVVESNVDATVNSVNNSARVDDGDGISRQSHVQPGSGSIPRRQSLAMVPPPRAASNEPAAVDADEELEYTMSEGDYDEEALLAATSPRRQQTPESP